jgi:hypothetical protein
MTTHALNAGEASPTFYLAEEDSHDHAHTSGFT